MEQAIPLVANRWSKPIRHPARPCRGFLCPALRGGELQRQTWLSDIEKKWYSKSKVMIRLS